MKGSENIKKLLISILILIVFYWVFNTLEGWSNWKEVEIFRGTEEHTKGIIYWLSYWTALVAMFILVFHVNKKVNIFSYIFFFLFISIDYGYKRLNGDGLTYEDTLLVIQNVGFSLEGEVMKTYLSVILISFLVALIVILLMIGLRYFFKEIRIRKRRYLLFPMIVFLSINYIIYVSNANRLAYPSPFKVPSLLFYTSQKGLYVGGRDKTYLKPIKPKLAKHIVWIVDESVRADQLQINGIERETTPFLKSIENEILNYGIASSGAVCSDYSHIMLMSGLQFKELPDKEGLSRKYPTIFQYAEDAGMESNLLYAPGNRDVPEGYMTQDDFDLLDHRYHTRKIFPEIKPENIDIKSIDFLEEIIRSQVSSFTYFLKYGCHFHYETTYPKDKQYFKPVQDINSWERDNRTELLNSYHNALRWEVDYFFQTLYNRFKGEDVLIIYTSDHGQHLMEYPNIKLTHCVKKEAPREMAMVPLFILPMNDRLQQSLQPLFESNNINKGSHFNIFPTTLHFMGYDSLMVRERYGKTLLDSLDNANQFFISGDIFGRSSVFKNEFVKDDLKSQ